MSINIVDSPASPKATITVAGATPTALSIPKKMFPGAPRAKTTSQWDSHFRQLLTYTTFVKDSGGNIVAADESQTVHAVPLFVATGDKAVDAAAARMVKADVARFKDVDANGHGLRLITRYLVQNGQRVLFAWRTLPKGVAVA